MKTVTTIADLRETLAVWRAQKESVALVPTMGNLHDGHIALVAAAKKRAHHVVTTIFVNPTQFGPNEDFTTYPRTLDADQARLTAAEASLLFTPPIGDLYPNGTENDVRVHVPALDALLCGAFRPGHFTGVATIVCKLFNLVQPDVAIFGEKDYQQLLVIRRMAEDLFVPTEIVGHPIVRESDGLAMSSRNGYLAPEEQRLAPKIYQSLRKAAERLRQGEKDFTAVEAASKAELEAAGFHPDYFSVRHAADLSVPLPETPIRDLVILVAARLGKTRLIDNLRVT